VAGGFFCHKVGFVLLADAGKLMLELLPIHGESD
jgi:hypothetical protein